MRAHRRGDDEILASLRQEKKEIQKVSGAFPAHTAARFFKEMRGGGGLG